MGRKVKFSPSFPPWVSYKISYSELVHQSGFTQNVMRVVFSF